MRANRAYHVIVSRKGPAPSFLADPERVDHVEVVGIASSHSRATAGSGSGRGAGSPCPSTAAITRSAMVLRSH